MKKVKRKKVARIFELYKKVNYRMNSHKNNRADGLYGIAVCKDADALAWRGMEMRCEILEAFLENRNPNWHKASYLTIKESSNRNRSYERKKKAL